jgi:hypothetical protein
VQCQVKKRSAGGRKRTYELFDIERTVSGFEAHCDYQKVKTFFHEMKIILLPM